MVFMFCFFGVFAIIFAGLLGYTLATLRGWDLILVAASFYMIFILLEALVAIGGWYVLTLSAPMAMAWMYYYILGQRCMAERADKEDS